MAYVLGFFTADGNMVINKRGAHFISIEITDSDILEKMKLVIGSNHKISIRKRKVSLKTSYRLQIGSKEIFKDLVDLGLTPNKSKTIDLPKIPIEHLSHFVRGYFDGDGNVSFGYFKKPDRKNKSYHLSTRFTSGSRLILNSLKLILSESIGTSGSMHVSEDTWRLIYSVNDSKKLFTFMYGDGKVHELIYLERKYRIYKRAGIV